MSYKIPFATLTLTIGVSGLVFAAPQTTENTNRYYIATALSHMLWQVKNRPAEIFMQSNYVDPGVYALTGCVADKMTARAVQEDGYKELVSFSGTCPGLVGTFVMYQFFLKEPTHTR